MQFTDLPVSIFTLAPTPETALSNHVRDFIAHLKNASIIPKTPTDEDTILKAYVINVDYDDYVNNFNNYWDAQPEVTRIVESVLAVGIQGVSVLFGRKPPEKTFLRDTTRAKVAERLLATYSG